MFCYDIGHLGFNFNKNRETGAFTAPFFFLPIDVKNIVKVEVGYWYNQILTKQHDHVYKQTLLGKLFKNILKEGNKIISRQQEASQITNVPIYNAIPFPQHLYANTLSFNRNYLKLEVFQIDFIFHLERNQKTFSSNVFFRSFEKSLKHLGGTWDTP